MTNASDRGWGSGWPNCDWDADVAIAAGRDEVAFPGGINEVVAPIFTAFLDEFDRDVERLRAGWCWGFACRAIGGTSTPSNHSWALAVDVNAPYHPWGKAGTFSASQRRKIHELLDKYEGIRWGGDYNGRIDSMHFEWLGTPEEARELIDRLGLDGNVRSPQRKPVSPDSDIEYEDWVDVSLGERSLSLGSVGSDVAFVQRWLGETDDGYYGPVTKAAVEDYQQMQGLEPDGIVGPNTWAALGYGDGSSQPQAPDFPLPNDHWFGVESSDPRNHSGYWPEDRPKIKRFQSKLRQRGYELKPDGWFGLNTESVVYSFQREASLLSDGLVGPKTWVTIWEF